MVLLTAWMGGEFGGGCCCLVSQSCPTLGDLMACSTPGFPVLHYLLDLLKLLSIESVMPSIHHLCHLLILLPSIFSSIRVFSSESALHIGENGYTQLSPFAIHLKLTTLLIGYTSIQKKIFFNVCPHKKYLKKSHSCR